MSTLINILLLLDEQEIQEGPPPDHFNVITKDVDNVVTKDGDQVEALL